VDSSLVEDDVHREAPSSSPISTSNTVSIEMDIDISCMYKLCTHCPYYDIESFLSNTYLDYSSMFKYDGSQFKLYLILFPQLMTTTN